MEEAAIQSRPGGRCCEDGMTRPVTRRGCLATATHAGRIAESGDGAVTVEIRATGISETGPSETRAKGNGTDWSGPDRTGTDRTGTNRTGAGCRKTHRKVKGVPRAQAGHEIHTGPHVHSHSPAQTATGALMPQLTLAAQPPLCHRIFKHRHARASIVSWEANARCSIYNGIASAEISAAASSPPSGRPA